MRSSLMCLLCASIAQAQVPQRDLFSEVTSAYWKARGEGQFDEAAARRQEARSLIESLPLDDPQYAQKVQQVSQMYENGGFSAQARSILQNALLRATTLGESHPARIQLLGALANSWQQDRNLLRAVECLEKAVAAAATDSPGPLVPTHLSNAVALKGTINPTARYGFQSDSSYLFQRLSGLYRQLGRPGAAAAMTATLRDRSGANPMTLASMYEQQGQLDQAAAIYMKQAEQPANPAGSPPWTQVNAWQMLSNLYLRQQRFDDSIAAIDQALAVLQNSTPPPALHQTVWLRQNLAQTLIQAGRPQAADEVYQQIISDAQSTGSKVDVGILTPFAHHLANTKRAGQAEQLIKEYLANNPNLQPWEEMNALYTLSNIAQSAGHAEQAEQYRRSAAEKQPAPMNGAIAQDLIRAQSLLQEGKLDEGFNLVRRAIASSERAPDREILGGILPSVASMLAMKKEYEKAEEIYNLGLDVTQGWSVETVAPYLNLLQARPGILQQRQDRVGEVPAAIEQYRSALIAAHGPQTGRLDAALHLAVGYYRLIGAGREAVPAARELLALEESLSGTTSEPYLFAAELAADVFEFNQDPAPALALRRQAVTIVDLVTPPDDPRRCWTRLNTANALARNQQFDEAESLAAAALAIARKMRPPQEQSVASQLEQIRRMERAQQSQQ